MQSAFAYRPRCDHVVSSHAFCSSAWWLLPPKKAMASWALYHVSLILLLIPLPAAHHSTWALTLTYTTWKIPNARSQKDLMHQYWAEIKTFETLRRPLETMSTFGCRCGLSKHEDLDEDELLASLTAEELQELEEELADIDPDENLPIGLRQRDHTAKTPTWTMGREALITYWENETRKLLKEQKIGSTSPRQGSNQLAQTLIILKLVLFWGTTSCQYSSTPWNSWKFLESLKTLSS